MLTRSRLNGAIDTARSPARTVAPVTRYQAKRISKRIGTRAANVANDVQAYMPEAQGLVGRAAGIARRLLGGQMVPTLAAIGVAGLVGVLVGRSTNPAAR